MSVESEAQKRPLEELRGTQIRDIWAHIKAGKHR